MAKHIRWRGNVSVADQLAAIEYLSLVMGEEAAVRIAGDLADAVEDWYRANDILRAARLMVHNWDREHVANVVERLEDGRKISPILLVRTDDNFDSLLIIADGFHRVLAVHDYDYSALCAVRIVGPYVDMDVYDEDRGEAATPVWGMRHVA